jgi:hypothetical protein
MLTTDPAAREAFIAGLRELADFLAASPAVPVPKYGETILLTTHGTDEENRRAVDEFAAVTGADTPDGWNEYGSYAAARTFGVIGYKAVAHSAASMAVWEESQRVAKEYRDSMAAAEPLEAA